jgi:signal transduction histidine kinase/HAMP domain-containing protein
MALSLRRRIFLTLAPLLVLLAVLGGAGAWLLYDLGGRIGLILKENYESVIAMERLNEALERIDSSFQLALAGEDREDKARGQYEQSWKQYREAQHKEEQNITLPEEPALVKELAGLTEQYRKQGDAFYRLPPADARRKGLYFKDGLLDTFTQIKKVSRRILDINQENMEDEARNARRTANDSLLYFELGLGAAVLLAVVLAWYNSRVLLRPISAVTRSAQAIGAGNLDQVVPVLARDELGQLADAFNVMARQLRAYRQTSYDRLLRAQRTSQASIDSFPDPVLVIDPEGAVEMANPAAQALLGVHPRREGEIVLGWAPPEALRAPLEKALRQQQPYMPDDLGQAVVFAAGGQEHFFLPRVLPIADPYGNTLGAAVLLLEVTRFRLLDQVKSDLVATVSHELKTPLTSIRLVVHLLLEETVGPLTPKQTELLLDARDNTERLLDVINNLLDLARIEEGRAQLRRVPESPGPLLRAAADTIKPRADDKQVALAVEAPDDLPPVAVDAERLGHALANLLDNALAHTQRGGRITLGAARSGGAVVLSVADTGSGIPPEHLPHLFQRFYRVPGPSQEAGTGLGLAIVREIVTAHGGSITCESRPGEGATFRIMLPLAEGVGNRE